MHNQVNIFSYMSNLAKEHNAINLAQGFPDYEIDEMLKIEVMSAVQDGFNQYAPMGGHPILKNAIISIANKYRNYSLNETEITITPGATYAIFMALAQFVNEGDEVIVLEPAYDSYIPDILFLKGVPKPVALNPEDFTVDWSKVRSSITKKTTTIMINNPHNPSGNVWSAKDFKELINLVKEFNLKVVSDEVYEHLVFDGQKHFSVLEFPELKQNAIAVYSFGKVVQATGWKIGYLIAPSEINNKIQQLHQFVAFSVNSAMQVGLGNYLLKNDFITDLSKTIELKRDFVINRLQKTRWRILKPTNGSYFQLINYSQISHLDDRKFTQLLTTKHGVAAIPISPFYSSPINGNKWIRICLAKKDTTLLEALNRISDIEKV